MELEKAKDGLQKHWEWAINQQEARKVKPSKFNALYANYLLGEAMGYRQAIIDIMVETKDFNEVFRTVETWCKEVENRQGRKLNIRSDGR